MQTDLKISNADHRTTKSLLATSLADKRAMLAAVFHSAVALNIC
jgi:hypothetical protein